MSAFRNIIRTARPAVSIAPTRAFATSTIYQKSVTDTVKAAAETVNRTVSNAALKGVEVGQKAGEVASDLTGAKGAGKQQEAKGAVKGTANEAAGEAKGLGSEAAGKAKGLKDQAAGAANKAYDAASDLTGASGQKKQQEAKGAVKGAANEAAGTAKGLKDQAAGKAKGVANEAEGKVKGSM